MFAVIAAVLFLVAVIIYGSASGWAFWMLLGLIVLAVHLAWPYSPWGGRARTGRGRTGG